MERGKIEDEIAALQAKIKGFEELLASHQLLLGVVKEEAIALRNKYADPRRTEICQISGEVDIEEGVIIAKRHIHATPEDAEALGVKDKDIVSVKIEGERGLVFDNVLIRSGEGHKREAHFDTDEGNAAGCGPDAVCEILK